MSGSSLIPRGAVRGSARNCRVQRAKPPLATRRSGFKQRQLLLYRGLLTHRTRRADSARRRREEAIGYVGRSRGSGSSLRNSWRRNSWLRNCEETEERKQRMIPMTGEQAAK